MDREQFKKERQAACNGRFINILSKECLKGANEEDIKKVLHYLVQHNIIRQSVINSFVVCKMYPVCMEEEGSKEKAVAALCNIAPLERSAVYNILGNQYTNFRRNKIKFP